MAAHGAFRQPDWSYLAGLRQEERNLARKRHLPGAMPVSWTGRISYWDFQHRGSGTYTVRAAVIRTLTSARWDAAAGRLVDQKSKTYDSAPANEYTLGMNDGVWKVVAVKSWMWYEGARGVVDYPKP